MSFCANCGVRIDETSMFCPNCGSPCAPGSTISQGANTQVTFSSPEKQKKPVKKYLILCGIALVIVAIAIAAVVYLTRDRSVLTGDEIREKDLIGEWEWFGNKTITFMSDGTVVEQGNNIRNEGTWDIKKSHILINFGSYNKKVYALVAYRYGYLYISQALQGDSGYRIKKLNTETSPDSTELSSEEKKVVGLLEAKPERGVIQIELSADRTAEVYWSTGYTRGDFSYLEWFIVDDYLIMIAHPNKPGALWHFLKLEDGESFSSSFTARFSITGDVVNFNKVDAFS